MLRVAVIGVGGVAANYCRVYANLPGVQWTLAVDVNPDSLPAARAAGAQRVSTRFEDALADDIDVVDISTPNFLHEEQACAALAAGKHVLLQKPIANSLAAADRILAAAAKSKAILGMYMGGLNNPMAWEIRQLLDAGMLGPIQSIRARDAHRGGLAAKPSATNWRGDRDKTGGGSFIQLSIHGINILQWWLRSRITQVTAFSANQYCPHIGGDDVTVAAVRFGDSAKSVLGVFDSGYASDGNPREIYGCKGYLKIGYYGDLEILLDEPYVGEILRYTQPGQVLRLQSPPHAAGDAANPFNQNRMFLEALAAGKPPPMSGADGRHDLAVVMAAYQSACENRPVNVPAPPPA